MTSPVPYYGMFVTVGGLLLLLLHQLTLSTSTGHLHALRLIGGVGLYVADGGIAWLAVCLVVGGVLAEARRARTRFRRR